MKCFFVWMIIDMDEHTNNDCDTDEQEYGVHVLQNAKACTRVCGVRERQNFGNDVDVWLIMTDDGFGKLVTDENSCKNYVEEIE